MTSRRRRWNAVIAFALVITTFLSSCSTGPEVDKDLKGNEEVAENVLTARDSVTIAWDRPTDQTDLLESTLKDYFAMRVAALKGEEFTTSCCTDDLTADALLRSQKTHWGEERFIDVTVQVTVKEVKKSDAVDTVSLSELTWIGYSDDPSAADVEDEFGWVTEHKLQIDTTESTVVLDSYSEEDVNGHSSQTTSAN